MEHWWKDTDEEGLEPLPMHGNRPKHILHIPTSMLKWKVSSTHGPGEFLMPFPVQLNESDIAWVYAREQPNPALEREVLKRERSMAGNPSGESSL